MGSFFQPRVFKTYFPAAAGNQGKNKTTGVNRWFCLVCATYRGLELRSVVGSFDLEVSLRVFAGGADFGGFIADMDVSAVTAFPALGAGFDIDFAFFHIFDKFIVAVFVTFFDFGDSGEEA